MARRSARASGSPRPSDGPGSAGPSTAGRAPPAARRVRQGRGGLPPGQPGGPRATAWPGASAIGPGEGRGRRDGDPPRGGRDATIASRVPAAGRIRRDHAGRTRLSAAHAAADELAPIADEFDAPLLRAAPATPRGPSSSPRATPARRSSRCAWRGPPGRGSRRPTKARGPGSSLGSPAGRSGTRIPRAWSSTRRARSSSGSARRRTWPGWRRCPAPQGSGDGGERAHRARSRGASPRGGRQHQPEDRGDAGDQRPHGPATSSEHLRQARRVVACRRHRIRVPARSDLTRPHGTNGPELLPGRYGTNVR